MASAVRTSAAQHEGSDVTTGRVLIVEQHALVAMGLQLALAACRWDVDAVSMSSVTSVLDRADRFQPDCVLLSMHPAADPIDPIELIAALVGTGAQVIVLTAERRRTVLAQCLEAGAAGWIATDVSLHDVEWALAEVIAGGSLVGRSDRAALLDELRRERLGAERSVAWVTRLTQREAIVLAALVDGLTAEEIAECQYVALTTVRSQIRAVLAKLGVRSQVAAVAFAAPHRALLPGEPGIARDRRRTAGRSASSAA